MPHSPVDQDFNTTLLHTKLMMKLNYILGIKTTNKEWCTDVLAVVNEAMSLMTMNKRELGSNSDERKVKSLKQWWFSVSKATKSKTTVREKGKEPEPDEELTVVERDTIVVLEDANGQQADFIVMGIYNKYYKKWFLTSQDDKDALGSEQKNEKAVRLHVRKVEHEPANALYKYLKWKAMLLLMKCSNKLSSVKSLQSREAHSHQRRLSTV